MQDELARQLALLPSRLGWHMLLTTVALAAGILISVPLAIFALRFRPVQGPLLALASIFQTVPSLAMLALLVVILSTIGFVPAIIALTLYSILPVLRNTVTGIAGVDPAIVEAARGVGMTDWQMLLKVQFPLAAPVIIAGIRTSAVWVVGIATLSTPVGQVSLGNYIFEGLQLRNNLAVLTGVIAAAVLAIVLDLLIRLMEVAAVQRNRTLSLVAVAGLACVVGGGVAPLLRTGPDTFVGSKTFTEQYILADVIVAKLRAAGFNAEKKQGMGSTILFESLANGSIDVYVDYTGTIWSNIMKRQVVLSRQEMFGEMCEFLENHYSIVTVGALGFENAYSLAMRRGRAEELGIKTICDLARHAKGLSIGGDYEFFGRPEWIKVRGAYGLRFSEIRSFDSTLMYSAVKNGDVDVITAFSSDGRITAYDLLVLADPKEAFPPYDAVLLVSSKAAKKKGFVDALRPLVGSVSNEQMQRANMMVDVEKRTPGAATRALIQGLSSEKK
jgi:osmoprotectant transport system permease protein